MNSERKGEEQEYQHTKIDMRTREGRHFARATPRHPKFEKWCTRCSYAWVSRVLEVKACPRCKARFDYPKRELLI